MFDETSPIDETAIDPKELQRQRLAQLRQEGQSANQPTEEETARAKRIAEHNRSVQEEFQRKQSEFGKQ